MNKGRIVAIIQARMGSTRLPGKILLPLAGKTVLWHIYQRVSQVKTIDEVVIATSDKSADDQVEVYCRHENLRCSRGSEDDVLDRFYQAAISFNAQHVIRITGDCPLVDPIIIRDLIDFYFLGHYDYCGVATGAGAAMEKNGKFPDGYDAEIFSFSALKTTWAGANEQQNREHVTPFIWRQPTKFRNGLLKCNKCLLSVRLTLDNPHDYALIQKVYLALYSRDSFFGLNDVQEYLRAHSELLNLNHELIGKEGYEKFWKNEE